MNQTAMSTAAQVVTHLCLSLGLALAFFLYLWRLLGGMVLEWARLPRGASVYFVAHWHLFFCIFCTSLAAVIPPVVYILSRRYMAKASYCAADHTRYVCDVSKILEGSDDLSCGPALQAAQMLAFALYCAGSALMFVLVWWMGRSWIAHDWRLLESRQATSIRNAAQRNVVRVGPQMSEDDTPGDS